MKISELTKLLESQRNQDNGVRMQAYMRDQFSFYGIQSTQRRAIAKPFISAHSRAEFSVVISMIHRLWHMEHRECQYIAMDLFSRHLKKLDREDISFIKELILTKSWWDTVDWLAGHAVGKYFQMFPEDRMTILHEWSESGNIWLIRTCIIFQLFYKENTDTLVLEEMILGHAGSKEFFINKASGWALRQYSKTNPKYVTDFVNQNSEILDSLTKKEALKWIKRNYKK